ncbi:MAG: carbohydrate binding domain-containing protein, partial [Clostridia bacterium]|nr:carbohydrate binding domain-containing protein [Clostridia bacterium]
MKKLFSLILVISILCSLFSGFAALAANDLVKGELLVNGDFELYGTSFGKWSGTADNVMFGLAHSGNRSMKVAAEKQKIMTQKVYNIEPGQEYTFSAWLYVEELGDASESIGGGMKIEFYGNDKPAGNSKYECFPGEYGKWTKCSIGAIAPEGADTLVAFLRIDCGGVIYWDDASVIGAVKRENYEEIANERDMAASAYAHSQELLAKTFAKDEQTVIAPGAVNAVVNPSFEEPNAGETGAKGWDPFQSTWGPVISITDEEAHTGQYSAKITSNAGTYNPWIKQNVKSNFIAGKTYVLSAWVKIKEILPLGSVFMKAEFYGSGGTSGSTFISSAESNNYQFSDTEWHPMKMVFTMPEGVSTAVMYLRTSTGDGVIYYDDVEIGPAESANAMAFTPKFIMNYTDVPNVETVTTINYINKPIESGSVVEYTVRDGDNVIIQEAVPAAATINWSFPTEKLAQRGKAYTISAAYKAADGTVMEATEPQNIYRYDRPTVFDDQNRIIVDGKPLDVVLIYGAKSQFFQDYVDAGITVIRIDDIASPANRIDLIPEYRRLMDEAHKYGLKVIFALYGRVAGHPFQLPTTKKIIEEFKDHPALVAWMLCDEPCYNFGPGMMAESYAEMLEYLEISYNTVRTMDPHHAAFICECTSEPNSYDYTFKYADIACVDLYPKYNNETFLTYRDTAAAVASVYDKKEIWNLGYASTWDPAYVPDDDALRIQNYLTVWAGASGFGYYTNDDFSPTMLASLKKSKDTGEMAQLFDHFVRENSPVFDEYLGSDYWHRSWVTKDGKMYLVVKEHKNDGKNTEVNFNLKSTNGLVEINGFTAKLVNGTTEQI